MHTHANNHGRVKTVREAISVRISLGEELAGKRGGIAEESER